MTCLRALSVCAVAAVAFALLCSGAAAADVKVWNYDVLRDAYRVTEPTPLKPMTIIGSRNGTFSGTVAVESAEPIKGLRASVGALSMDGATIPAERLTVRYAMPWASVESETGGLDILLEAPPAEVGVYHNRALVGVWVTVSVPADAKPGVYRGELAVEADGLVKTTVPVELTVAEWSVPNSQDFKTWIEIIQSPDTLAIEYDVPLWSEKHWEMIAKSFDIIKPTGSRVVYVPLLRNTNQGNAESMVRWVKNADGTYKPNFDIMDKYLDIAQKHLGEIKLVVFYAWDAYLVTSFRKADYTERPTEAGQAQERWDLRQQGLIVTMLDEKTGKTSPGGLPLYTAPESRAIWEPFYAELRKRMKARGIEDKMALGMVMDEEPSTEEVKFLQDVTGGLSWVAHSHYRRLNDSPPPNKSLKGIANICYEANAYGVVWEVKREHPDDLQGWQVPQLRTYVDRFGLMNGPALRIRQMPQLNITGRQRGLGRIGGDFWHAIRDKRGRRSGMVFARYPANHWRGLNIPSYFLAPGPEGPASTARLENLREGVQECEARIFLESVLANPEQNKRIGADLAKQARAALDAQQRDMWQSIWSNEEQLDKLYAISGRSIYEAIWGGLGKAGVKLPGFWDGAARSARAGEDVKGRDWFAQSPWKQRTKDLYAVAGEVQKKLN